DHCARLESRTVRLTENDDVVARLGGDEFAILLAPVDDPASLRHFAQRVLATVAQECMIGTCPYQIKASVGISMCPENSADELSLLTHADIALYDAKARGGNNCQFYSPARNKHSFERLSLEADLRHGVPRGELVLHYQPKVLHDGRVGGVEALVRW